VRQALLTGEIDARAPFVARNLATLEKANEEEAKLRRAGLVADEDWQARWYLDRIAPEINSVAGLDSWYGKLPPEKKKGLEWSPADLLPGEGSEADRFPKYFALVTSCGLSGGFCGMCWQPDSRRVEVIIVIRSKQSRFIAPLFYGSA
jgi:ATP-dependent helicase HrpA